MRELKFRAWDKEELEMISPDKLLTLYNNRFLNESLVSDKKVTLMQYTGLKDINDVDIYEGDVLTTWIQGCKQVTPYIVEDMRELYLETERDDRYYRITKMEIIGNIYTNPELRK